MFKITKIIRSILKRKNLQIRAEREKLEAAEWANKILSAYIAVLAEGSEVKVKKNDISRALTQVSIDVSCTDEYYIIRAKANTPTAQINTCAPSVPERGEASGD